MITSCGVLKKPISGEFLEREKPQGDDGPNDFRPSHARNPILRTEIINEQENDGEEELHSKNIHVG